MNKTITLVIDVDTDNGAVRWTLGDSRGLVSAGESVDTPDNLVTLWSGDIEHLLTESGYHRGA